MQFLPGTVFVGYAHDKAAMMAMHILSSQLERKIDTLYGATPVAQNSVVFLTRALQHFPSGYLRLLPADEGATARIRQERAAIFAQLPQLEKAGLIIGMNPAQLDQKEYGSGLARALHNLFEVRPHSEPREGELSPDAKKRMRLAASRLERQAERSTIGW